MRRLMRRVAPWQAYSGPTATLIGTVEADVVISREAFGVDQRFVRLGHFLEARLGIGFLADVGVVAEGQLAAGALDLVVRGGALQARRGVVVLEVHLCSVSKGHPGDGAPHQAGRWPSPGAEGGVAHRPLQAARIGVEVKNGVVTLAGLAANHSAWGTPGLRNVVDMMTLSP